MTTLSSFYDAEISSRRGNTMPPFFAVLGHPVAHSLSPKMQNPALAEIAKQNPAFKDSKYLAFDIEEHALRSALEFFYDKNFLGLNLTIPLKEAAFSLASEFDDSAKSAGAANTLLKTPHGWKAYNTDGCGLDKALEMSFGVSFRGRKIAVLGAGGAARGVVAFALKGGAKSVAIINRTFEKAQTLAAELDCGANKTTAHPEAQKLSVAADCDILINATSIGLKPSDAPCIDFSKLPKTVKFFDMPYIYGLSTPSVEAAAENGIEACDGLAMLACQGAKALSIWTGVDFPERKMLEFLS